MSNLMERLDNLRALIQKREFLEGKGLSNEVNIRIFCYDPREEMAVRHFTEKLMTDQSLNCHLIEYNLYRVFLSICDDKRVTDRVAQQEEKKGKAVRAGSDEAHRQQYGVYSKDAVRAAQSRRCAPDYRCR